ncbi:uncharacterized protein LOC108669944 [Hyalella azteca]|uniref:Uncharacterized protein LOC108669944 n=1 Tax=Hyalella azteca TaxID=294128 RepID=A0A8B7NGX3_HYAAZ|nr:uncharacterized protein LOC108669944 [Hyalella azteca]
MHRMKFYVILFIIGLQCSQGRKTHLNYDNIRQRRDTTAKDIVERLPLVYEPGSAIKSTHLTAEAPRSIANETDFYKNNSSFVKDISEKSDERETKAEKKNLVPQVKYNGRELRGIEYSTVPPATLNSNFSASLPGISTGNGYQFLLKQLRELANKSKSRTSPTVSGDNHPGKSGSEINNFNNVSIENIGTEQREQEAENIKNTIKLPVTTNETKQNLEPSSTTVDQTNLNEELDLHSESKLKSDLPPGETQASRGRPKISLALKPANDFDKGLMSIHPTESDEKQQRPALVFAIGDHLVYADQKQNTNSDTSQQTLNEGSDQSNSTDSSGPNKENTEFVIVETLTTSPQLDDVLTIQSHAPLSVSRNYSLTPAKGNVSELLSSFPLAELNVHEPDELLSNISLHVPEIDPQKTNYSGFINLTDSTTSPVISLENNGSSDLLLSLFPSLLLTPLINESSSNFNHTTNLEKEINPNLSEQSIFPAFNQNISGFLQNFPFSPARLFPQNQPTFNLNPSKSFNFHTSPQNSPSLPTSSSGLFGFDNLGLNSWSSPSYFSNPKPSEFTSQSHFGSSLGLPGSIGVTIPQTAGSTQNNFGGDLDLGILGLLANLGGFNEPLVSSSIDFRSSPTNAFQFPRSNSANTYQSSSPNQLLLKRFGAPATYPSASVPKPVSEPDALET